MKAVKHRIIGVDLVRVIAILFVISVHFFLNTGFYETKVNGKIMFLSIFIRFIVYNGVPLFILLTGYLNKDKTLSKGYYKKIILILKSYIIISIICILYKKFYLNINYSFIDSIIAILNFGAGDYSWYVNMYIGLFLLIPFLNILYNNLKSKENKKWLIYTLIIIVTLSPVFNYIKYHNNNILIIPDWWVNLYPILYYYIGCYIAEYKPNIDKVKNTFIMFIIFFIQSWLVYIYNYREMFSWDFLGGYNSIIVVITSVIMFLLVYNIDIKDKIFNKIIVSISILSFDMYLFSCIVDRTVYGLLIEYVTNYRIIFKYIIIIVPIVFATSYFLSYIKDKVIIFIKCICKVN